MRMTSWNGYPWLLRHLVVAFAYGLAYFGLVLISPAYWWPSAGLRLACLLLAPYRYWPALLVGEFVPVTYNSVVCLDQFGVAWVVAHSFPAMLLAMPVVKWFRSHYQLDRAPLAASMSAFLVATAIISATIAAFNVSTFPLMHLPVGYKPPSLLSIGGWRFLGNFLGTLMVMPVVMAIREAIASDAWKMGIRRLVSPHATWEGLAFATLFAALVVAGRQTDDFTLRYAIDAAFFIPVTWLAFRRGWQGAAFGSVVANIGIILIPHDAYDPGTILALSILAFTVTVMLLLGARTTLLQLAWQESREHLLLARQELYLNEVKLRGSAHMLDKLQASMNVAHTRIVNHLRFFVSPGDEISFRKQLDDARDNLDRLRERLSPREWQSIGQPTALQETIGQFLKGLGISYDVDIRGALSRIAPDLNASLYRLSCEALVFLLTRHPTDLIRLQTSVEIVANGKTEVTVIVTSEGNTVPPLPRDKLLSGLGVGGMSASDMQGRAKLYAGSVDMDDMPAGGARVTLKLRAEASNAKQLNTP